MGVLILVSLNASSYRFFALQWGYIPVQFMSSKVESALSIPNLPNFYGLATQHSRGLVVSS